MAKRFKRKAKAGVMVRYWADKQLRYGIIASVPDWFGIHYKIRDCQTSMIVYVTEAYMTIHKA